MCKEDKCWPYPDWNSDPLAIESVANCYTDCRMVAPNNNYNIC